MSGQFEHDDLERALASAMRAQAERTVPAGDGLAKIRARTPRRAGVFAWLFRPATAGAALAITLVAATVIGVNLADDPTETVIADPPNNPVLVLPLASPTSIADDPTSAPKTNPTVGPPGRLETPPTEPSAGASLDPRIFGLGGGPDTEPGPITPADETRKTDGGIPVDTGGNYVAITAPFSGSVLGRTFSLEGQARVFEANVTIDVSQNGTVLRQEFATASTGAPEKGTWSKVLTLAPGNYRIDAYALSAADGTTKLASDTIWLTVSAATSEPASATPTTTPNPATAEVPGTEPQI